MEHNRLKPSKASIAIVNMPPKIYKLATFDGHTIPKGAAGFKKILEPTEIGADLVKLELWNWEQK